MQEKCMHKQWHYYVLGFSFCLSWFPLAYIRCYYEKLTMTALKHIVLLSINNVLNVSMQLSNQFNLKKANKYYKKYKNSYKDCKIFTTIS